jgi:hypothetical protein
VLSVLTAALVTSAVLAAGHDAHVGGAYPPSGYDCCGGGIDFGSGCCDCNIGCIDCYDGYCWGVLTAFTVICWIY